MNTRKLITALMAALVLLPAAYAADTKPVVRPYDLFTTEERAQMHEQMQNAKTWEERLAIREQHQQEIQKRADAKGATLAGGPMMGRGGYGAGVGPGVGACAGDGPYGHGPGGYGHHGHHGGGFGPQAENCPLAK